MHDLCRRAVQFQYELEEFGARTHNLTGVVQGRKLKKAAARTSHFLLSLNAMSTLPKLGLALGFSVRALCKKFRSLPASVPERG